jgi:hypothetical protein
MHEIIDIAESSIPRERVVVLNGLCRFAAGRLPSSNRYLPAAKYGRLHGVAAWS